jgi:zinc protease
MTVPEKQKIYKKVLANGLTVLVRPNHIIPKVSIQLWYNVGSKDEKSNEKGIAHLIEHMIFKGTKNLTESDINMITHKLSGYCNAFTSYDYTGYLFDFPSHHWQEAMPIMADCMQNCTFKEEFLASEMKAVIQELKMYKDNYTSSLVEEMISTIFVDHPYHYPIIGFKQDLWSLKREALINFYKKHYIPNNATLVVVGDVEPQDVFAQAEKSFGSIKPDQNYKKDKYYYNPDIISKTVTMYRDVQQPAVILSYVLPGAASKNDYLYDVLSWVLGLGKGSRLHQLLVDELQLATDVEAFSYDLFDYAPFFIYFQPKKAEEIETIIKLIEKEISYLIENGLTSEEILRASKQAEAQYLALLEDNQKQAYVIGQSFIATGDENFLFNYLDFPQEKINVSIKNLLKNYFKSSVMHKGVILPLAEQDKEYWQQLQEQSDALDAKILSNVKRVAPVEKGQHVHTIEILKPKNFVFPRGQKIELPNGLKVCFYQNTNIPKIELILSMPGKHYYDPDLMQGLNSFMCAVMLEGTKNYNAAELAQAIESRGMSMSVTPGRVSMSMLSRDFEIGLELLLEVLTRATFNEKSIEKVRSQIIVELKNYWDDPSAFVGQLSRDQVYKNHPYRKKTFGDIPTIESIQKKDLVEAYQKFITPRNSVLSIVGDLNGYDVKKVLEKKLGAWHGPEIKPIAFPPLEPINHYEINYKINRDQVVLAFVGQSVSRLDKDFDKLLLFDQIFSGGVLGSMSSRLFALREESGLFYTVGGSLLSNADEQPGMVFVKTIVSLDRLKEAETALKKAINEASTYLDEHELQEAKNALANSLVDNFATNRNIASTMLFLERYGLPDDFFDNRAQEYAEISAQEILAAAKKVLDINKMVTIRIGRV